MQAIYLTMENLEILRRIKQIDIIIIVNLILLIITLMLAHHTDLDVRIQNHLFDFNAKTWLIDRNEPIKKLFFYQLPKIIFGVFLFSCFVLMILGFTKKNKHFYHNRYKLLLIFLGLSLIPLIAGNVKKFTNVYCPSQLEIYDGSKPYVKIFDHYPRNFVQEKRGQCFPAGHAVTGFALMILFFALERKAPKIFGLLLGLVLGWAFGFYQMAKGAHFLSDTVVAMLLCFLLAAIIARYHLKLAKKP